MKEQRQYSFTNTVYEEAKLCKRMMGFIETRDVLNKKDHCALAKLAMSLPDDQHHYSSTILNTLETIEDMQELQESLSDNTLFNEVEMMHNIIEKQYDAIRVIVTCLAVNELIIDDTEDAYYV